MSGNGDRAVDRAARAVVMLWFAWVIFLVLVVLGCSALAAWILLIDPAPVALLFLFFAGGCAATLLRLRPQPSIHRTALSAELSDATGVTQWVCDHVDAWSPTIRLVPEPGVWTEVGELKLGLPLLLCLRDSELRALCRVPGSVETLN